MSDLSQLYEQMQTLARGTDADARGQLCGHMTQMISGLDETPSQREWALVNEIYGLIVADVEKVIRAQFASELSKRHDAPRDLIKTLGSDEIDIARPVLTQSRVLLDEDLIDLVEKLSSDHRTSIATRPSLPETVSDTIVKTGDVSALKALLHNETASISEPSFLRVADYCASARDLHEPLIYRKDTPWSAVEKVISVVSDTLLNEISDKWDVPMPDLVMMVYKARDASTRMISEQRRDTSKAFDGFDKATGVDPNAARLDHQIIQALNQGDLKMARRLVEHWTSLRESIVQTIMMQDDLRLLATVYKAKGTDQLTFSRTIFALRGLTNNADSDELRKILRLYRNLDRERAIALTNLWREEPKTFQQLVKVR